MTIALSQFEAVGARTYAPEGPFGTSGNFPLPSFKPGTVTGGDAEAEFVYLIFSPITSVTLNQGDCLVWDNSFTCVQSATGSAAHPFGASVGAFYLGGRVGDPASTPASGLIWSYTFTPGVYGIWVQRAGTSLMNIASINAQSKPVNTTAVAGQVNQPAAPLASSMGIVGMWSASLTFSFTGTVVVGSTVITAPNVALRFITKGQTLSGTGIAVGAIVTDIQGSTITMSLACTASGTVTIVSTNSVCYATTTNGSPTLTNVTTLAGIYPNQILTGTGVAGLTIVSITGNAAPYTITLSGNASATANTILMTATGYYETFLRWPYIGVQN